MKIVSSLLLLCLLLLLHFHPLAAALAGGWQQIQDVKDPHVVEIGKFAVSEYNSRNKANLTFVNVVSGETQVVSGTNYRLIVAAKAGTAGGPTKNYEAVVWEKPWQKSMDLTSFKPVDGRIH